MDGARPTRFDALLAAGVVALTQVEVWRQGAVTGAARVGTAVALLAATLSLLWRRPAAMACAVAIAAGLVAQAAISGADLSSVGWTLATLVALYSAGRYLSLRRALLALAVIVAGLAVRELRDLGSYRRDGYQNAFWWLLVVVPFGAGIFVHSRGQALVLRRVAARTEAESAQSARAAVAEERARIARELHDVVAHDVSAVVLQAEAAEEMLNRQPERTRESLHAIQRLGREALGEMRTVLGVIRGDGDGPLAPQPTLAELPALIERNREAGLPAELCMEGAPRRLAPGLEVSAYRIVQEALTNVRKHAQGARATVTVRFGPSSLEVEVADDGPGAAAAEGPAGHGLIGMRERVSFFGGRFSARPGPAGGFLVRATFPSNPSDHG
jgi:signal transduction histidine kinase